MMRMHYLQHVPFETPANIETYFRDRGYAISATHMYSGEGLPQLEDLDVLVVMGGPMSVGDTEEYPWLSEELTFIAAAIEAGKKVIGICLGAQLIAASRGARVYPGPYKEIGWMPIYPAGDFLGMTLEEITVFHWHGDTFDLPEGAQLIYTSAPGTGQGFSIGENVLALQCHLEMNPASVRGIVDQCGDELVEDTYVQSENRILNENGHFNGNRQLLEQLLDVLCGVLR